MSRQEPERAALEARLLQVVRSSLPGRGPIELDSVWSEIGYSDPLLARLEREFGVPFPVPELLGIRIRDTLAFLRRAASR